MKYTFDKEAADKAVMFFEHYLTHVKGELGGEPFILEKWEREEIIKPLFGMMRPNGLRRYRVCYVEIPKKNGKTTLAAGVGLYLLFVDGEPGAEIISAAAERDQAAISFNIASGMVQQNSSLSERSTIYTKSIIRGTSSYKAISAEANTKHGYNISGNIIDELHAHKNDELFEALKKGTASRRQPITFIITTAGVRKKGAFAWGFHKYAEDVKNGVIKDDSMLVVMYGADPDDDPFDPEIHKKANPNYGISVSKEFFQEEIRMAKRSNSSLNSFKRFHLNIWTSSETSFIKLDEWRKCNKYKIDRKKLKGQSCIGGLDLASTNDFTSLVLLFENYDVLPFFWIPKDKVLGRQNEQQIWDWHKRGFIELTPGNVTDYEFIEYKTKGLSSEFNIKEIAYDPWNSSQTILKLRDDGANMIEFRQGYGTMSPALKELEKKILTENINHGGNPILEWMSQNMMVKMDPAGNIKPDKEQSGDKIDGMVALTMAVGRMVFGEQEEEGTSIYETEKNVGL